MDDFRWRISAKIVGIVNLLLNILGVILITTVICLLIFGTGFDEAARSAGIKDLNRVKGVLIGVFVIFLLLQSLMIYLDIKLIKASARGIEFLEARSAVRWWIGFKVLFIILNLFGLVQGVWMPIVAICLIEIPMIILVSLFGRELSRAIRFPHAYQQHI